MKTPRPLTAASWVLALAAVAACGEVSVEPVTVSSASAGPPLAHGGPVDVLFVVDDSSSMADKQAYLVEAAGTLLRHLAKPNCVDTDGRVLGASTDSACDQGALEFVPVTDFHVGIVSTSLGGAGAPSTCDGPGGDLAARLQAPGQATGGTLLGDTNVFSWNAKAIDHGDVSRLIGDVQSSISAMGEGGCAYESQLESFYRFLIQPDPYERVVRSGDTAAYQGIDSTLLAQRKAFLRPDSTVVVALLTDENDGSVDPIAFGGRAWMYTNLEAHVKPGTSACKADPTSAACQSCFLAATANDLACREAFDGVADDPNVRLFHMKQRFGYDPLFPVTRYVTGLTSPKVPDRNGEHPTDPNGAPSFNYVGEANCTNPLFAAAIPSLPEEELCHLPRGGRGPNQIFLLVIGGVPHELLRRDATDDASPMKANLTPDDYQRLVGADPEAYRFDGIDPHMIESTNPRVGISSPDAIVQRDWDTQGRDLERACTFALSAPHTTTDPTVAYTGPCGLDAHGAPRSPGDPLCAADGASQLYAGAYPAVRELLVTKGLGYQGVVASICPVHVATASPPPTDGGAPSVGTGAAGDPLFGYDPAADGLIDRMAGR